MDCASSENSLTLIALQWKWSSCLHRGELYSQTHERQETKSFSISHLIGPTWHNRMTASVKLWHSRRQQQRHVERCQGCIRLKWDLLVFSTLTSFIHDLNPWKASGAFNKTRMVKLLDLFKFLKRQCDTRFESCVVHLVFDTQHHRVKEFPKLAHNWCRNLIPWSQLFWLKKFEASPSGTGWWRF